MPSEPDTQLLQKILDEQGYIIAGHVRKVKIGHVFKGAVAPSCDGGQIWLNHRSVVIGGATAQEFREQQRKYRPSDTCGRPWPYHYKVVAE